MFSLRRLSVLLLAAGAVHAASTLTDLDPDLDKTRPLLVANQAVTIDLTLADIEAARTINAALSPAQLARWKRIQVEVGERSSANQPKRTIFDFQQQLDLSPMQVTSMKHQITSLNQRMNESRARLAANHAEIRKLHPDLGMTELSQLPRPSTLVEKAKEIGLSSTQVTLARQVAARLNAMTEECRRRILTNATSLRPLLEVDAGLERIKPFVQADAEILTELTLSGLRSSLALHEKLNPAQREKWHQLERSAQGTTP